MLAGFGLEHYLEAMDKLVFLVKYGVSIDFLGLSIMGEGFQKDLKYVKLRRRIYKTV